MTSSIELLASLSTDELVRSDLAFMNLTCSVGLPGWDASIASRCIQTLDEWACVVHKWTTAAIKEHIRPDHDLRDQAAFKLVALHTALHRHCGARYNPEKVGAAEDAPFDLSDMCIAAITSGQGGTCATLPIVYVSVGRRLGYPLRLCLAKSHVFCRWDDNTTSTIVNLDGGENPMIHSDDYYRQWPVPMGPDEELQFGYLRSLSPREELALLVASRGWVWESAGDYSRAVAEFALAADLDSPWPRYPSCIRRTLQAWSGRVMASGLTPPEVTATAGPAGPRRWPSIPWEFEVEIGRLEAAEQSPDPMAREGSWSEAQVRRAMGL